MPVSAIEHRREPSANIQCCAPRAPSTRAGTLHARATITGSRKSLETIAAAQRLRPADPSADDREDREQHQRNRHRARRFVDVVLHVVRHARLAEERHVHEPEHIKRRHSGGDPADHPQRSAALKCRAQNSVFAEKSRQRRQSRRSPASRSEMFAQ